VIEEGLLVELRSIGKTFGSFQVLRNVDLKLRSGQTLALVGDNGAGKSTLIKIGQTLASFCSAGDRSR
jgi:ABC-type sugar transport system ATPase subunit